MKVVKDMVAAFSMKSEFAARRNKLYRIAYSWCHDPALADDLVQETIYKALKNASRLRDVKTMDSWLYRILYNCWQDYLRVKGRNVEFVFFRLMNVSRQRRPLSLRVPPLIFRSLAYSRMSFSAKLLCSGKCGYSSTAKNASRLACSKFNAAFKSG